MVDDDPTPLDPTVDKPTWNHQVAGGSDVRVRTRCRRCRAEVGAIRTVRNNAFVFWGDHVDTPAINSLRKATHKNCGGELSFRGLA